MAAQNKIGLEAATLAIYAEMPRFESPDPDIGQGLYYIMRGAKVWPGNGVEITDDIRDNYLAGEVVCWLGQIILDRTGRFTQQDPLMHNPFLVKAIEVVEELIPLSSYRKRASASAHAIYETFQDGRFNQSKDARFLTVAELLGKNKRLQDLFVHKVERAGELVDARGTVTGEAFSLDDVFEKMEDLDTETVPPAYIDVDDAGNLVEPAVWNVLDMIQSAGAKSFTHDFPYYSTWDAKNGVDILDSLLEDLVLLRH